ncbi:hypothetical protein [Paraburkholderia sp. BL23I1N1]|uniref:hypothetical protein n=1 Tax=Paraburkholderia sp. BL23I1N1 TaxID=1938802 RepID=UPI000E74EDDA|nr:hypothetical protein [Paraburkholderia sp. BL23I1N1]
MRDNAEGVSPASFSVLLDIGSRIAAGLQCLTVTENGFAYHGLFRQTRYGFDMTYPYDLLTAACLFIIVVSTSIMLALT